ncbi:uncharacterized protein SCHCODRAFT_02491978 [Schizophyllum commune H4-8]|nr:uncharacterized protein SCHCODRAFT_02491978 [Schizophyllum commune H4-8]KAI5895934.1 hypothetical protein SCHCODRAFT_02491978 [Schizophyllum commune H4-8]
MDLSLSQQLDVIATESLEIEADDIIDMHKQQHLSITSNSPMDAGLSQELDALLDMSLDIPIEEEVNGKKAMIQTEEGKGEQGGNISQIPDPTVLPSLSDNSDSAQEEPNPLSYAERTSCIGNKYNYNEASREDIARRHRALHRKLILTEAENSESEMDPDSELDGDGEEGSSQDRDDFISHGWSHGERSQEDGAYHLGLLSQNVPGGPQFRDPPVRRSIFGGREILRMEKARDSSGSQDDGLTDGYEIGSFVTDDEESSSSWE